MRKALIALVVTSAIWNHSVASAQSTGITIFGRVQAEYSGVDVGGQQQDQSNCFGNNACWGGEAQPIPYQGGIGDNSRSSRWGLQMTENLGRGLKAIARLEEGMNAGSGTASNPREQWVGLSNSQWGEMKFGRVQSPFKDFAGGMTIDPFAYTSLQANGAGGTMTGSYSGMGSGANSFVNGAVRIDSITVRGFSLSGLLRPVQDFYHGQNDPPGRNEIDFQIASKYTTNYKGHDLSMFGGYSRDAKEAQDKAVVNGTSLQPEESWRIGGTWKHQNIGIVGQYESISNSNVSGASNCTGASMLAGGMVGWGGTGQCNSAMNGFGSGNIWHAGANYQLGNTLFVAQGGMTHGMGSPPSKVLTLVVSGQHY
jgi:GBP family porin